MYITNKVETSEAVENLNEILEIESINYFQIGLNDLHLADGTVEKLTQKISKQESIFFENQAELKKSFKKLKMIR